MGRVRYSGRFTPLATHRLRRARPALIQEYEERGDSRP